VNKYLPYEEIIAKKLQDLPVPPINMAIWDNISKNIGVEKRQSIFRKRNFTKFVIIGVIFLCIIVLLLILLSRKKKTVPVKEPPSMETSVNKPVSAAVDSLINDGVIKNEKPVIELPEENINKIDSVKNNAPVILQLQKQADHTDSSIFKNGIDSVKVLPPPQKKGKGVTGISDSDYKLIIKKDSM
jgi:preprotein translocase subunit SecG